MIKRLSKHLLNALGYDLVNRRRESRCPKDFDADVVDVIERVKPFTMTTRERLFSLCTAVKYIEAHQIPGTIVECGVWRGGSMMAAALMLSRLGSNDRDIFLLDTYEGMTEPGALDVMSCGVVASQEMRKNHRRRDNIWCHASLEEVRENMLSTGYPLERLRFVKGPVEETLPEMAPETIALLRLDTDWYASTRHELRHLFPRLVRGGVLILDDYGSWKGARAAVDEYIEEEGVQILLNRIDHTGRAGVKQ